MLNAFRLPGRARRVENEQRMLRLDRNGLAFERQPAGEIVPPKIALRVPWNVAAGPAVDDHAFDRIATAHRQRFVDRGLERDLLAAAELTVGGDHEARSGVGNALVDAFRREAAEHD